MPGRSSGKASAVAIANPARARRLGIGMVFQHFSLFETLTVAENIALALEREPRRRRPARAHPRRVARDTACRSTRDRHVHTMSVGERQRVEIVRCLLQDPRLLIMDEPTSVLTPQAVEKLFETLRRLAAEGCSILYISHKLDEIRALCHKATVLRAGRVTGECDPRQRVVVVARAHDDRRRPAASAASRGARAATRRWSSSGLSLPADDPFGTSLARHQPDACARARSSASPACPATARRS